MNNKKLNYRYKFLLTFVTLILIIVFTGLWVTGEYLLYRNGNKQGFLWVLILYIVASVLIIGVEVFTYIVYERLMKNIFRSIDGIMETFPKPQRNALEEIACGDDTILLQKALEWFSYRQVQSDRAHFAAATTGALASFSHEIFWEFSFLGNSLNYGDYWDNTYGENRLFEISSIDELLEGDARQKFLSYVEEAKKSVGKTFAFDAKVRIGKKKYIRVRVAGTSATAFNDVILFGVIRDIEQIDSFRESLIEKRKEVEFLIDNVQDRIIYEVDVATNKMKVLNKGTEQTLFDFGDFGDFENERGDYWAMIHPDYLEGFIDRFLTYDHLLVLPDQRLVYEYQIKTKHNDWIWVRHSVCVTNAVEGSVKKVIGCIHNISERKREELKGFYKTNNDSLTGALQWTSMLNEYERFKRRPGKRKAVIIVDIDGFRHLNQQYGFEIGDRVLRAVVMRLWERQSEKSLVGRIKDDEFVVSMLDVGETDEMPKKFIEAVFSYFEEPITIDNTLINICLTAGYAIRDEDSGYEVNYRNAKEALLKCRSGKKKNTNAYLAYDEQNIEA